MRTGVLLGFYVSASVSPTLYLSGCVCLFLHVSFSIPVYTALFVISRHLTVLSFGAPMRMAGALVRRPVHRAQS